MQTTVELVGDSRIICLNLLMTGLGVRQYASQRPKPYVKDRRLEPVSNVVCMQTFLHAKIRLAIHPAIISSCYQHYVIMADCIICRTYTLPISISSHLSCPLAFYIR